MCIGGDSPPPPPPPMPAQAPPAPPAVLDTSSSSQSTSSALRANKGRSGLRIDRTQSGSGAEGSGLNIPI